MESGWDAETSETQRVLMSPRLRGFETEFERHIVFSWATTDWIWFLTQFYPIAMAPHLALPGEDVISRTIESLRRVAAQVTEDEAPWKGS